MYFLLTDLLSLDNCAYLLRYLQVSILLEPKHSLVLISREISSDNATNLFLVILWEYSLFPLTLPIPSSVYHSTIKFETSFHENSINYCATGFPKTQNTLTVGYATVYDRYNATKTICYAAFPKRKIQYHARPHRARTYRS